MHKISQALTKSESQIREAKTSILCSVVPVAVLVLVHNRSVHPFFYAMLSVILPMLYTFRTLMPRCLAGKTHWQNLSITPTSRRKTDPSGRGTTKFPSQILAPACIWE
ncbi:hypothetical protein B0H11DRAFT_2037458 [Mycena galericulata]|nr:hypothetical protein B0H11DRAFT_2037458 [Mycena galericulata]